MSDKRFKPNESAWTQIAKRINLQSLGEFMKVGSDVSNIDLFSFPEREQRAFDEMTDFINNAVGVENQEKIMTAIINYVTVKEGIYLSLGMKIGSQLIIKLTDNFESDY